MWERSTCSWWALEVGRGCEVAESTSSVGRGTAGLLLMKGMLPLLYGTVATLDEGEGAGEPSCGAWKCHGKKGDGDTSPENGESCGGIAEAWGVAAITAEVTSMASFWEAWHALRDPSLKLK